MTLPIPRSALLACLAALLMLAGCSRVYLAYNTADFFLERYADDWLALDGAQMADWRPALKAALGAHRQDELPYLAAFFDELHKAALAGFEADGVGCLLDEFEEIYRRHFRIAVDLAAPLLVGLDAGQIRALDRKFREDREAPDEDPAAVARRERNRAHRYAESVEWWIGPLSSEQREIVREVTAAMPDTAAEWEAYRAARQDALIRLLQEGAGEAPIRRHLSDWLVDYRGLPPGLQQARREIRRRVVELFVRIDATLSSTQRSHLADRLLRLRDDFLRLQERPRRADLTCPGSA